MQYEYMCAGVCTVVHIHGAENDFVLNNFIISIAFVQVSHIWALRRVIMILTTIISHVVVTIIRFIINCAQPGELSMGPLYSPNTKCGMRAKITTKGCSVR